MDGSPMRVSSRKPIHYAWIVAAVSFITLLGAAGFRSAPGVLMVPLQNDFGWSRATISLAISVNLLLFGLMAPFAAALMRTFGIRRVAVIALLVIAFGALLTTRMSEPWHLILTWGVIVGLGTGSMTQVLAATVVNRWFAERRATVLGILTAAGATGQLAFLPFLAWLADEHGWRYVSVSVALGAVAVVPIVALFMKERPSDVGLRPYGATTDDPPPTMTTGRDAFVAPINVLKKASGRVDFWLLAVTFFICGASTNGLIGTHLIPAGVDHGMTQVAAASLLALIGIFDVIGTIGSGWLTDRWDARKLLFIYYALRGVSLLLLPIALDLQNAGLWLFIVFYGLDWVATVPPTVTLATKAFGRSDGPIVYGWIFTAHQIGAAAAAFAAGAIRSSTGDYLIAFVLAGGLCIAAAAMALQIGRSSSAGSGVTPASQTT
jgi:predicted MFS family arabinose efflux permease